MFGPTILTFLVGLFVGGNLGVLVMCLLAVAKHEDMAEVRVES